MRKLLFAAVLLVPAFALAWDLPKGAPKLPDSVNKAANDAGGKIKNAASDAAKDAIKPLNHDDQIAFCATELPKQAECKQEFCAAMTSIRTAQDPKFRAMKGDPKQIADMNAQCLKEIVADAAGDDAARKNKCTGWAKERGEMAINKTEADGMVACWSKPNCKDRVACWEPRMSTVMATTMAQKKAPAAK